MPDGTLRLATSDLWSSFDLEESFLGKVLATRWSVVADDDADLLVYGPFGGRHAPSRATKVLCSGEPVRLPRRLGYDYSLSWHVLDDDRHLRVPQGIWALLRYPGEAAALASRSFDDWVGRPFFCNFIYSNPGPRERREAFAALSRRRFVHSPGAVETNADPLPGGRTARDWWPQKVAYQRQFRFTIAFESAPLPGYTSEKAVDALLAGTIPVYWGNPELATDLDRTSFVDAAAFGSWDELADHVVHLDENPELARPFFEQPRPLLLDLDEARAGIVALFERARAERGLPSRIRRTVRPWLFAAAGARGRARRR